MSISPRAPYGSLLKGDPLGRKKPTVPKPESKAKPVKAKKGSRK